MRFLREEGKDFSVSFRIHEIFADYKGNKQNEHTQVE